jgi:phosphoglycolate phosphatase
MQTGIQAILFDKDGTLFGYADTWLDWTENVLKDLSAGDKALFETLAGISGYDPVAKSFARFDCRCLGS